MESAMSAQIAVFIAVLLIAFTIGLLTADRRGRNNRKQAAKIKKRLEQPRTVIKKEAEQTSLRKKYGDTSLPLLTRFFARLPSIQVLRDKLARSGLKLTAERYLTYCGLLFAATVIGLNLTFGMGVILALLLGIVTGLGLPHFLLGIRIGRQNKKFLSLFPDAIDLIVRGLRAGLPVTESIKMVAKEIDEPVGTVFRLITEKMALGVPLEKALYETAGKYKITEFDFFVTSIALQRETGGNLSEILSNLSEALRSRLMMRLKIKAMSSEAKASMYIIGVLPFIVTMALQLMSPEYLAPLWHDFRGNIALGIALGMLGTGITIMFRMTKFEI